MDVPRCRHAKAPRPKKVSGRIALLPHARASNPCGNALRRACQVWRGSKLCDFAFVTTHLLERTRCVLRARLPHARRASRGSRPRTSIPPQTTKLDSSAGTSGLPSTLFQLRRDGYALGGRDPRARTPTAAARAAAAAAAASSRPLAAANASTRRLIHSNTPRAGQAPSSPLASLPLAPP